MRIVSWRRVARLLTRSLIPIAVAAIAAFAAAVVRADESVGTLLPGMMPPQPSSEEPAPPANTDAKAVTPVKARLPSCAVVTVTPGHVRADGSPWDALASEPPDIRIVEATTGTEGECHDTWSCSITMTPVANVLKLTLSDIDPLGGDDPMGDGACAIGKSCNFGVAKVTVRACE